MTAPAVNVGEASTDITRECEDGDFGAASVGGDFEIRFADAACSEFFPAFGSGEVDLASCVGGLLHAGQHIHLAWGARFRRACRGHRRYRVGALLLRNLVGHWLRLITTTQAECCDAG